MAILGPDGEEVEEVWDDEPHRFGHFRIPEDAVLSVGDAPFVSNPYPYIDAGWDIRKDDTERRLDKRGRMR